MTRKGRRGVERRETEKRKRTVQGSLDTKERSDEREREREQEDASARSEPFETRSN